MSKLDYLGLRIDLKRVEESLTERLARIEAEANASDSADDATVAAVERMLVSHCPRTIDSINQDEDIEDDFAGGTSWINGAPCTMTWRSHHAELISRLKEDGYETCAAHLARLADVNSLKKPFTPADEAGVIKSILEYLVAFTEEMPAPDSLPASPTAETDDVAANQQPEKSAPATGGVKVLELADLAELVGPSVVQVDVTGPEEAATGSGFVLDKQGTIVTNYHVIEDATAGRIIFSDRTSAPITGYLGVWPEKDIALVRVECPPEKLHPLRLATSAPRQGERVAAFGSPLGLQQSVSEGIVSAVRESKELRALGPINVNARLIQTTTPISHGNSGGPLVDMKGMVVGVNTWTFRSLGGENVNFAVAAAELPPLLLAKNEIASPLPANDPAADGVRRILRRASAHSDAGDYDRAIADYTEAIRLEPKFARAYFLRGFTYHFVKHDYYRAIADFTEVIRLDPKDGRAYFFRGLAYQVTGQRAAAERDFAQAKRLGYKPPT